MDIGTQTVRLFLAETEGKTIVRPLVRKVIAARAGEGVDRTGRLKKEAIKRTVIAIGELYAIARNAQADPILIYATSAVRDAENREELLSEIEKMTGIRVQVLSGEEEAAASFLGAVGGRRGSQAVMDIGGGSTEILFGVDARQTYAHSFQLGAVRLGERYGCYGKEAEKSVRYAVCEALNAESEAAQLTGREVSWTGVAGTLTSLCAWDKQLKAYDSDEIQDAVLTKASIDQMADALAEMDAESRSTIPCLQKHRIDIIGPGAWILAEIADYFKIDRIRVSEQDGLQGFMMMQL